MKNIFGKISELKNSLKNQFVSTSGKLMENIKKKVAILTTATALGVSSSALATEWHKVDTPGIWPQAFAEKNFGTKNWKWLTDRDGNSVIIPAKDLILGREYTIAEKTPKTQVIQKPQAEKIIPPTPPKQTEITKIPQPKKEVIVQNSPKTKREMLLKELFSVSYGDLMGLDLPTYKTAIAGSESNGSYSARNDKAWKLNHIKPGKWAWGKYQFTTDTLARYGVELRLNWQISEAHVQDFLSNIELQESLMEQYTRETIEKIRWNSRLKKIIENGKKPLPEILAKWHIGWSGSIEHTGKGTDWLKTPITKYAKVVSKRYLSLVTENDAQTKKPTIEIQKSEIQTPPTALQSAPTIEKVSYVTASANDTIFTTQQATHSVLSTIKDSRMQARLAARFAPYENEYEAINADMQKHRKEAIRLKKEALTIFGPSREKFLKQSLAHVELANKLKLTLDALEKQNTTPLRRAA